MYHDRGQIAMELIGFDRGVTLLGGFPFPICTSSHGSAHDIAGKGIAHPGASKAAVLLAAQMARKNRARRRLSLSRPPGAPPPAVRVDRADPSGTEPSATVGPGETA